ncbi:MAG: transcription termination/antitermination NusG family protein [Thermodesulfobacteriota bacterium]|nr:transcription termination/antitermination NusG family protein [Thermodesulfobacteriota bacterium]
MTLAYDQNPAPAFPENILAEGDAEKPWRVAHTKSRREKALAGYMAKAGIGYYLPMMKKRQTVQKRVRYSLMPVFSGYLFFRGGDGDRHKAMRSNHIARVIPVRDQQRLIQDLENVQKVLLQTDRVYPFDFITEGQAVRVKKGPMKDVEGVVIKKNRNYRLVVSVNSIMQAISVEIDADDVAPMTD